jgi:hypothetical protein
VKRRGLNLVIVACIVAVACVDLSAPGGPASISQLLLPSTFVVRGDVMRDSAGAPALAKIIAFTQKGDSSVAAGASFFITDSIIRAHFGTDGLIVGDSFGIAHVVGQFGNVQTPVFALPVTVAPTTMTNTLTPANDTLKLFVGSDSATTRGEIPLTVRVTGGVGADTTVQGVWVRFTIDSAPQGRAGAFFLLDDQKNLSSLDTTDASGVAGRTLVGLSAFLADSSLRVGKTTDSVVVRATTVYKGKQILSRIVIPLKVSFPTG